MQPGNSVGRACQSSDTARRIPTTRKELILAMRAAAMPLRSIAESLGVSVGLVTWSVYGNRPRVCDTARSVVRRVPVLGWQGSRSCYDVKVSLPRVSILEAA